MLRRPPRSTLFPTRRSSDLMFGQTEINYIVGNSHTLWPATAYARDRKSTRLNSSHLGISYAVFCLKKKKRTHLCTCNPTNRVNHVRNSHHCAKTHQTRYQYI